MTKPDFDRSRRRVLKAMAGGAAVAGTLGFPAIVRAQQDTLKFAEAAIADSKRQGLLLAVRARWVALAVIAVTLPIINPNWDVIYYIVMLGLFAAIGWAQLNVGKVGRSLPELFLIFCDLVLLTLLCIGAARDVV